MSASFSQRWTCLTLVVILFPASSGAPAVDTKRVPVGQTATLVCTVNIQGQINVVWKDKDMTTLTYNTEVYTDDKRISIHRPYHNDWELRISDAKLTDSGNYTCCMVVQVDCSTVKTTTLIVQIPPTITEISPDVTIPVGANTTLSCSASGIPRPNITWKFHQIYPNKVVELASAGPSGAYLIRNARANDSGKYECVADNNVLPVASRFTRVSVTFKPEVMVPYREVRQSLGSDTLLECHIRSNPAGTSFWEKDGHRVETVPDRYRLYTWQDFASEHDVVLGLVINDLTSDDLGWYLCVSENSLGTNTDSAVISAWQNGTLRMVVSPRDVIAQTGQNVVLDCSVEGLSKGDRVTWGRYDPTRIDSYVPIFDSSKGEGGVRTKTGVASTGTANQSRHSVVGQYNLMVRSVAKDDEGPYVCQVSGLGNYSATLTVISPDSSVGSGCSALADTSTSIMVAVIVSIVTACIIIVVIVVFTVVHYYRRKLQTSQRKQGDSNSVAAPRFRSIVVE